MAVNIEDLERQFSRRNPNPGNTGARGQAPAQTSRPQSPPQAQPQRPGQQSAPFRPGVQPQRPVQQPTFSRPNPQPQSGRPVTGPASSGGAGTGTGAGMKGRFGAPAGNAGSNGTSGGGRPRVRRKLSSRFRGNRNGGAPRTGHAALPWVDIVCVGITIAMILGVAFHFEEVTFWLFCQLYPILEVLFWILIVVGLIVGVGLVLRIRRGGRYRYRNRWW